ncbi:unnamed protein product [Caretta caretta]
MAEAGDITSCDITRGDRAEGGILIPDILQPDIHWESDDTINYLKPPVLGEPSGFTLESQDEVVVGRRGQAVWREEHWDRILLLNSPTL